MRYSSSRIQQENRLESVDYLIHMVDIGRLDPTPSVGAMTRLTPAKKSHIVESLILGLPIEMIWAEQNALGKIQLLSGFEVIASILEFYWNKLPLKRLRMLRHLEGLRFSEIDFAEQKHFLQMEISVGTIYYESDPMLKCLFVEGINRDKYGFSASQISRSIIFNKAIYKIKRIYENYFSKSFGFLEFEYSKSRYDRYILNFQEDILLGLLIIYLKDRSYEVVTGLSMESYAYSRSHTSNYHEVDVSLDDVLDNALNKVMLMLDTDDERIFKSLNSLEDFAYDSVRSDSINAQSVSYGFSKKSALISDRFDFSDYVISCFSDFNRRSKFNSYSTVRELVDRLMW